MTVRHFLSLNDLSRDELTTLLDRAAELKQLRANNIRPALFTRRVLAMIFEKSSTRTRMSFEAAMVEGGGQAVYLSPRDTQLGRGEPITDTARVLSEMSDALMVRTFEHDKIETIARASSVPVINGLTNSLHPCQLLADMLTYRLHRGAIKDRKVAWVGDGNNMCNSYINAARLLDFQLVVAVPEGYEPELVKMGRADHVELTHDAAAAAGDADLVVTDVWASMGQEDEARARHAEFQPFQVNAALMSKATGNALFMHCLPAHRGEEVTTEVIDHPESVVWDEAGNRLHAQKALLEFLLNCAWQAEFADDA
ncbi:MAG: ornithine carbamoyltransferase [Pseudomonadota bacterium]